MTVFKYRGFDSSGKVLNGRLVAESDKHARSLLKERGMFPSSIEKEKGSEQSHPTLRGEELMIFTRQLATMIEAGIGIDLALDTMMTSPGRRSIRKTSAFLRSQIQDGRSLSEAMGHIFPYFYTATIEAGEKSGALSDALGHLAAYIERRKELQDKIVAALIYPLFVAAVSVIVAGILLTYVGPEIALIFERADYPLPTLTEYSLGVAAFIRVHAWTLLGSGVMATLLLIALGRLPYVRWWLDRAAIALPGIGWLLRLRIAVSYLSTLSLVLSSRLPVVEAMAFAGQSVENRPLRRQAERAVQEVRQGQSMAFAIKRLSFLPSSAIHLIESGERSGQLKDMVKRAALFAESRLLLTHRALIALLEPCLMILVAALALIVILSILLPIFELQSIAVL